MVVGGVCDGWCFWWVMSGGGCLRWVFVVGDG